MKIFKKAFTLVELIIVISILAILSTIAYLSLSDYPAEARDVKLQSQVWSLFDKMKILNSKTGEKDYIYTSSKVQILNSSTLTDDVRYENIFAYGWGIDFPKLGEDKSKFPEKDPNFYKTAYAEYQTTSWKFLCHLVKINWEKTDKIVKTDCPKKISDYILWYSGF